jgi:HAE1 family hydrophobic/amphiphilic exporter-1
MVVIFALIAIIAACFLSGIAIDRLPDVNVPILIVSTGYAGAGPQTVEKTVSKILESSLVNVGGLKTLSSTSSEGSSVTTLEFDYGTDLDSRVNDVRDRIDQVRGMLPDDADTPLIIRLDPASFPILRIAVRGSRSQNELRAAAETLIQDRLNQVDGVASTSVLGGQERIVRVQLSQNRLEAYSLSITELAGTLARQNLELGAGSLTEGSRNYSIRTTGEYSTLHDIAETVVTRKHGADIRLRDIGTVFLGYEDEKSTVYINGESGVYISVTKQSGSNAVAVADRVYKRLEEIKDQLPPDISLEVTQDETSQIRDLINELVNSAVSGAALAMLILFLFLRNIRGTLIIGISIPFSIMTTLLIMNFAGMTLNMMTMTGLILGVGMIVDSSIVILENIFKYRERGEQPSAAAVLGSQEVIAPITSSMITTVCVFVPIFLFKNRLGILGQLFQDMIIAVAIALISSLLIAIFLVPVLAAAYFPLNSRIQSPLKNPVLKMVDGIIEGAINGLTRCYRRLLSAAMNRRGFTICVVVFIFAGSLFAITRLHVVFMPDTNEDTVTLTVELPLGTTYEDTRDVMLAFQEFALTEIQGIKSLITNVGTSSRSFLSQNIMSAGELSVKLDMRDPASDTGEEAKEKLRRHFRDFPSAGFSFDGGMNSILTGGADIDIVLRIDDIDAGLAAAREIQDLIQGLAGLNETVIDLTGGLPQVEVVIDRGRAYNMGLSVSAIAAEIAASLNGLTATTFRYNGEEYDVKLMLQDEDRKKIPDLQRITVQAGNETVIPLSNFARLEKGFGPVSISRENQSRVIHITGDIQEGYRANEVEQSIGNLLKTSFIAPEGVSLYFDGQWTETTNMLRTFILILTLAILLVFGAMAGQYESFKDPIINMCTIPLMLIGVAGLYLVTGHPLNAFSMVGIVMLSGIVVNNGIILVDYTSHLVRAGLPVKQACIDAAASRLRPVLMTTLTTIIGLIPLSFVPGESAIMTRPIGLTVTGGLGSATFITLIFIPVMYSLINKNKGKPGQ